MASLLSLISPSTVRTVLRASPAYDTNRDRAAVVIHDGLAFMDAYVAAKPFIFAGSLIGLAASLYALWKRKHKGGEAIGVYVFGAAACAGAAYVTAPWPAQPPADPNQTDTTGGVVSFLDTRAATLRADDPNFADEAFGRLVQLPGIAAGWNSADPAIQAAIL